MVPEDPRGRGAGQAGVARPDAVDGREWGRLASFTELGIPDGVREAIEKAGATLRYLPKYSPDLNPIELPYSKFKAFLEGFPQRYLLVHTAEEVMRHMQMADELGNDPVLVDLKRGRHWYDLTLVTKDRPFLFATLSGVLAAWGMNIVKANAFSNAAGVVVDTFHFTDRFRTLELNLSEWARFKNSVVSVMLGEADLVVPLDHGTVLRSRAAERSRPAYGPASAVIVPDSSITEIIGKPWRLPVRKSFGSWPGVILSAPVPNCGLT